MNFKQKKKESTDRSRKNERRGDDIMHKKRVPAVDGLGNHTGHSTTDVCSKAKDIVVVLSQIEAELGWKKDDMQCE